MSWLFSQALVAEYLADTCSDGAPSAPSNGNPTQLAFLPPDRMTAFSRLSRFGMTFKPLTDDRGAALLTSYLAAFHVKPIPAQLREKMLQMISGRKCYGSWQMSLPGTFLPKTCKDAQSTARRTISKRWVTKQGLSRFQRQTWVLTTFGKGIGYLHTPTVTANYTSPSMQKWPSCRAFVAVFGKPSPTNHEWMMGWPPGWTELRRLEMDKYQSWLQQHSPCYQINK